MYMMENYIVIKKNGLMAYDTRWMTVINMLSEKKQKQKSTYCIT